MRRRRNCAAHALARFISAGMTATKLLLASDFVTADEFAHLARLSEVDAWLETRALW